MKVYLCGPINGCTDDQATNWRDIIKDTNKHIFIDPMRRDYRGKEDESVKEIVQGDLEDIREADLIVANCWQPSYGTAMEIFYANAVLAKRVIVIHPRDKPVSPWLRYHAAKIVYDLSSLLAEL